MSSAGSPWELLEGGNIATKFLVIDPLRRDSHSRSGHWLHFTDSPHPIKH